MQWRKPKVKHLPVLPVLPMLFIWLSWHPLHVVPEVPGKSGPVRPTRQCWRPPDPFDLSLQTHDRRMERCIPKTDGKEDLVKDSEENLANDSEENLAKDSEENLANDSDENLANDSDENLANDSEAITDISLPSPDRVANLHRFGSPPNPQSKPTKTKSKAPQDTEERDDETNTGAFVNEEHEVGEEERPRSNEVTLYVNFGDYNLTLGPKQRRTMGWVKNKLAEFLRKQYLHKDPTKLQLRYEEDLIEDNEMVGAYEGLTLTLQEIGPGKQSKGKRLFNAAQSLFGNESQGSTDEIDDPACGSSITAKERQSQALASLQAISCEICQQPDDIQMMLCDGCNKGFHTYCVHLQVVPEGDWFCLDCENNTGDAEDIELFEEVQKHIFDQEDDSDEDEDEDTNEDQSEDEDQPGDDDQGAASSQDSDDQEGDYVEYEDREGRFEHYVPVTVRQAIGRDFGIPETWRRARDIPGTGNSCHILCPENYVFTKKEPTMRRGGQAYAYNMRCQETRRGEEACPCPGWTLYTHPEDPVRRGELQPLYYDVNEPPPTHLDHNHQPDLADIIKR